MPCNQHDITVLYTPLMNRYVDYDRRYISHVPYTSNEAMFKINAVEKSTSVWCDKFSLLGQVLRKIYKTIYLTPVKFQQYRFLIDAYTKDHNVHIQWCIPKPAECSVIISDEDHTGYIQTSPSVWEILDHNSNTELLITHFNQIIDVTIPTLQKLVSHISSRISHYDLSSIVEYLISHEIDDELTVSCSFVILYYKRSPEEANKYALNWLRRSKNTCLKPDLWTTNWYYYSEELQQELTNRMPYII